MFLYGLIGYPLGHSKSAILFNQRFRKEGKTNHEYRLFPMADLNDFHALIDSQPELFGLNVTIPYKTKIIDFLDELDETAQRIGAVNTITIFRDGKTYRTCGHNTDAGGFLRSLPQPLPFSKALVLGTGGAAKAVAHALRSLNIDCCFVSRSAHAENTLTYAEITPQTIEGCPCIINATPVGMYPHIDALPPIPYETLTPAHFLIDLVYNPPQTGFLKQGVIKNCTTMNGSSMLVHQADLAYSLFQEQEH